MPSRWILFVLLRGGAASGLLYTDRITRIDCSRAFPLAYTSQDLDLLFSTSQLHFSRCSCINTTFLLPMYLLIVGLVV